jgi:hypothetical protein
MRKTVLLVGAMLATLGLTMAGPASKQGEIALKA